MCFEVSYGFCFFASLLGLYNGIGSRSCKAKRGEPRIAEETCMCFPFFFFPVHSILSITNYWLWQTHSYILIDCALVAAGRNHGNAEKSGVEKFFFAISVFI